MSPFLQTPTDGGVCEIEGRCHPFLALFILLLIDFTNSLNATLARQELRQNILTPLVVERGRSRHWRQSQSDRW